MLRWTSGKLGARFSERHASDFFGAVVSSAFTKCRLAQRKIESIKVGLCGRLASAEDNFRIMRPIDIQQIGSELAVKWSGGGESFILLETLRRACPCAGCKGETDIMGNLYKNPEQKLTAAAFELKRIIKVGGYAIQPVWADGHATGIFPFDYLRQIADDNGSK